MSRSFLILKVSTKNSVLILNFFFIAFIVWRKATFLIMS